MIILLLFMNRDYSYLKVLYKLWRFQLNEVYRIRDTTEYLKPETT